MAKPFRCNGSPTPSARQSACASSSSTPVATIRLRGRSSSRQARPGRSAPFWTRADPKPNTLIAYAATPESEAEDCNANSSPYTAALRYLFVRGLDVRLAFGRVREEVFRKTGNQEPFVYGSLRRGGNTAIVPSPFQPEVDLQGEKSDYSLVEKVDTARAWQVFLVQHPTGFFSDDARQRLRLAEANPTAPEQRRRQSASQVPMTNRRRRAGARQIGCDRCKRRALARSTI